MSKSSGDGHRQRRQTPLSLGFNVRSEGHYSFSLYVSMIAETNWLLSNNLESDMNNEPAVWNVDK